MMIRTLGLGAPSTSGSSRVNRAVQSSLDTSVVDVSVHFEQALLSSAEIVALRPGDVVPLAHHVDRPLTVSVAGIKCFPARPGQRGNRREIGRAHVYSSH